MPTPAEVRNWSVDGLSEVGAAATKIADAVLQASDSMYTAIHDGLAWQGEAKTAADAKSETERTQMRAIVTAYDDLGTACTTAFGAMEHPLAEIKTILKTYVVAPVSISDDWTITGVEDWDSEAGLQLARIPELLSTLLAADATAGAEITAAVGELDRMAPPSALATLTAEIQKIKAQDPNAVPDAIATSPASFWAPDIPATTANTIIGVMTDVTRDGLETSAQAAGRTGVLRWVENWGKLGPSGRFTSGLSHFGIVGNAVGTVPAIVNDVNGGMSKPEAIVSESAGTVVGMGLGGLAGAAVSGGTIGATLGSIVPGAGTAAGFVVGAAVGAGASYLTSKLIQRWW